ncbi:MAG: hypothetical protein QXP02_04270 [Desulfurococcaceae archaeon]
MSILEKWRILERSGYYVVEFNVDNTYDLFTMIEIMSFIGAGV